MQGFKETEIGLIPEDWKLIELGSDKPIVCKVLRNGLTDKQDKTSGTYKVSRIETIGAGFIDEKRVQFISEITNEKVEKYRIKKGDILLSHINSEIHLGKTGIAKKDYSDLLHGMNLLLIRLNGEMFNSEFVNFYFNYLRDIGYFIRIASRAVNQSSINQAKIKKIPLLDIEKKEQNSIVQILSSIQNAIEKQQQLIDTTTELKKALMHKLFTEGTKGEPQKETEIGLVPESWEVSKLGNHVAVKGGKRLPKGEKLIEKEGYTYYIRVTDFDKEFYNIKVEGLKYISKEVFEQIKRYIIEKDNVYISIAGTIGVVGMIPEHLHGVNLTENAARLIINDKSKTLPKFIMYFLASINGQSQALSFAMKNAQPKLSLANIQLISFPIPSIQEQKEIINTFDILHHKLKFQTQKKTALESLFKTMLHELMTGKTRVKDIDFSNDYKIHENINLAAEP